MLNVIKVFICDDHSLFREGVKAALSEKENIKIVGEAVDGADLLNKLAHNTPDVILLDINMPRMDGMAVLPVIKLNDRYKNIKVIILSMHNQMSMVSKMMSLGANSYLTKNDDVETIYRAIVTCYHKEYFFNELTNKSLLKTIKSNPTVFNQDEEFNNVNEERKRKIIKLDDESLTINTNFKNIIFKGVITGIVGGLIVVLIVIILKAITSGININDYTPQ
jgi:DNA-binding NarL/FixJ family response regulator